jgi:hypothetical protein
MNDVIQMDPTPQRAVAVAKATPADIVLYAMEKGADIAQIEKFMDLQIKHEANEARKAFAEDMANFKKVPPSIYKDKTVSFGEGNKKTEYDHATIGNVCEVIITALAKHGFSHRWIPEQRDGQVIITCVITHRMGHKEETTLQAGPDTSGGKNGIQSIMSAKTYLERHTLLGATGLATKDQPDDDGQAAELDTALADKWITLANASATTDDLTATWKAGIAEINAARDMNAHTEFKAAVTERGNAIKAATPATPARTAEQLAEDADYARTAT